jgi:hypothetical protein
MSKTNFYFFLTKYIYFILPKIEDLETFKNTNNKEIYLIEAKGFMKFFENIDLYHFISDSDLFLINHLIFSFKLNLVTKKDKYNISLIRGFQIPLHP